MGTCARTGGNYAQQVLGLTELKVFLVGNEFSYCEHMAEAKAI